MLLHKDEQLLQLPTSERTILSQSIQKHRPFALSLPLFLPLPIPII